MNKTEIINKVWMNLSIKEKSEKGEIKRFKLVAQLSFGKVLDLGYAHKPNPFLDYPIGVDIEYSLKPINYSKVYQTNLEKDKLPFKDESFDTIIACETFEHLQNIGFVLKEINRVLKKNGRLIVSTPNPFNLNLMVIDMLRIYDVNNISKIGSGHVHSFLESDMNILLRKNGFKLKKIYGTYIQIPFTRIQFFVNWPRITFQRIYVSEKYSVSQ